MKRFVICDDDKASSAAVGRLLVEIYGQECGIKYIAASEALAELLESDFDTDVLLLDIELGPANSIELVKKHLKSSSALQIVYISGFVHYCSEVYDTRHISFLPKPVDRGKLKKAVDTALEAGRKLRNESISVRSGGNIHIIPASCLIYAESLARCIHLHTDDEELEVYEKLDAFCERLPDGFLQCHKSFVVNLRRVSKYRGDAFILDNGLEIKISQARRREVRESFIKYVEGC